MLHVGAFDIERDVAQRDRSTRHAEQIGKAAERDVELRRANAAKVEGAIIHLATAGQVEAQRQSDIDVGRLRRRHVDRGFHAARQRAVPLRDQTQRIEPRLNVPYSVLAVDHQLDPLHELERLEQRTELNAGRRGRAGHDGVAQPKVERGERCANIEIERLASGGLREGAEAIDELELVGDHGAILCVLKVPNREASGQVRLDLRVDEQAHHHEGCRCQDCFRVHDTDTVPMNLS